MSAQKSQISLYYSLKFALWDKALTILLTPQHPSFYQSFPVDARHWHALHWACCHSSDAPLEIIHHLLRRFPTDAVLTADSDGDTPLHVAIREQSSREGSRSGAIIGAIVSHCPAVVTMANKWGYTPLHTACSWDSATDVIRMLLEAAAAVAGYDRSEVMGAVDSFGKTPWRCFVEHWNLRLRYVIGCYDRDDDDDVTRGEWFDDAGVLSLPESSSSTSSLTVRDVYEQTCHLLRAITTDINGDNEEEEDDGCSSSSSQLVWYPLHASLTIPDCPWVFSHLLLLADPEQAGIPSDDDDGGGNLPLHLALAAASSSSDDDDGVSSYDEDDAACYSCCACKDENKTYELMFNHKENVVYCLGCLECLEILRSVVGNRCDFRLVSPESKINNIISHLLTIHPTSARLPDSRGRLPLTLALLPLAAKGGRMVDDVVIQHIFDLAPMAIATKDVQSHLYPFMTAAVGTARKDDDDDNTRRRQSCGTDEEDVDNDDDDDEGIGDDVGETRDHCLKELSRIFNLLMKDPTLVSLGIPYRGTKRK